MKKTIIRLLTLAIVGAIAEKIFEKYSRKPGMIGKVSQKAKKYVGRIT